MSELRITTCRCCGSSLCLRDLVDTEPYKWVDLKCSKCGEVTHLWVVTEGKKTYLKRRKASIEVKELGSRSVLLEIQLFLDKKPNVKKIMKAIKGAVENEVK